MAETQPTPPPAVPTDLIIPLHFSDDLPYARSICLDIGFRFDRVLDTERIRAALARLLEMEDWRKLGARLRLNNEGKLEYHLPQQYDEERPGFIYTTKNHEMKIQTHPIGSQMPTTVDQMSVFDGTYRFNPVLVHPNTPHSIQGWIFTDNPQLFIHVATFHDATLLTVTFLHTLTDAMGLAGLFRAWTAILSGRENQIPPFLGFHDDPLAWATGPVPADQHVLSQRVIKGISMGIFVFQRWWERFRHPRVQDRVLAIPGKRVQHMREKALQELASSGEDTVSFVSESDILLAWIAQMTVSALNPAPQHPVQVTNIFDARPAMGIPSDKVYIGNTVVPACASFPAHQIVKGPLSVIAGEIRRALVEQRTIQQVQAMAALRKKSVKETGYLPLIGDPRQVHIQCTNWHRARFFDIDFAAALVDPAARGQPCTPSYIHTTGPSSATALSARNQAIVLGKDDSDTWWVHFVAREEIWARMEELLRVPDDDK